MPHIFFLINWQPYKLYHSVPVCKEESMNPHIAVDLTSMVSEAQQIMFIYQNWILHEVNPHLLYLIVKTSGGADNFQLSIFSMRKWWHSLSSHRPVGSFYLRPGSSIYIKHGGFYVSICSQVAFAAVTPLRELFSSWGSSVRGMSGRCSSSEIHLIIWTLSNRPVFFVFLSGSRRSTLLSSNQPPFIISWSAVAANQNHQ